MATCLRYDQSIAKTCNSIPGVTEIWLANYLDVTQSGYTLNVAEDKISGITGYNEDTTSATIWYNVKLNRGTTAFLDELTADITAGSYFYKPTLNFKLASLEVSVRTLFKELSQSKIIAVVQTSDGLQYLLGKTLGLDVETATANTGLSGTLDMMGLEVTLSGSEPAPYIEIDKTSYTIADYTV